MSSMYGFLLVCLFPALFAFILPSSDDLYHIRLCLSISVGGCLPFSLSLPCWSARSVCEDGVLCCSPLSMPSPDPGETEHMVWLWISASFPNIGNALGTEQKTILWESIVHGESILTKSRNGQIPLFLLNVYLCVHLGMFC